MTVLLPAGRLLPLLLLPQEQDTSHMRTNSIDITDAAHALQMAQLLHHAT
jgi:hypothetical protein